MRISDWSSDVCSSDLGTIDGRQLLELWRKKIILYEDGTPRTKHLVTNPIIEIDPNGRTATAKSYYTVVQTIFTLPPQIIVMGRYDDRFVKENADRSEEHTSELQSLMRISYAVLC